MPTVNSIARQNDMLGQLVKNNFKSDLEAAGDSILVGKAIRSSANFLKSDFGGQPALTEMVENYTAERDNFKADFKNALSNLQKSSDELKNSVQTEDTESSEEVTAEDSGDKKVSVSNETARSEKVSQKISAKRTEPPKIEREKIQKFAQNYLQKDDEPKKETQVVGEKQADELSAVQNLVRDYNNAVEYLDEKSLSRNSNLTESLSSIGISVSDSGELAVDEKTLMNALQNDYSRVGNLMNGLTEQMDREMSRADQQSENLFPTIEDYANKKETDRAESYLYSARKNTHTANYTGMKKNQFLAMNV